MKNWFARLLSKSKQQSPSSANHDSTITDDPHSKKNWHPPIKIDGPYYQWLTSRESHEKMAALDIERKLLQSLRDVLESDLRENRIIPRMPVVIPQLLKCLRDQNVSMSKFSEELTRDPLLLAEVIRQANNARFEGKTQITSVEQAVMLVGEAGLRQLIAAAMMQPIINVQNGHYTKIAAERIWAHSQTSALLCRSLADQYDVDQFEAYLAGMLHNIGLITALRVMDKAADLSEVPHSYGFCNAYANCARQLSVRIGEQWELPATLLKAFQEQTNLEATVRSPLGEVLFVADQLAKARVMSNHGHMKDEADVLVQGFNRETANQYRQLQMRVY